MIKNKKAEHINLETFDVCLLELVKETGFKEFKIYADNRSTEYNSYYIFDINKKNNIVQKKYTGFNNKFINYFKKLTDFNDKNLTDNEIYAGLSLIRDFIFSCKRKDFIYRRRMVRKWKLNKEDTFISIYNANNKFFFKFILPIFWKFMNKKLFLFFKEKVLKLPINDKYNFLDNYYDKKYLRNFIDFNYKYDSIEYYYFLKISLKYSILKNIKYVKIIDFLEKTNFSDTMKIDIIQLIIHNDKIKEADKQTILGIIMDRNIDIQHNPVIKKIIENNIS